MNVQVTVDPAWPGHAKHPDQNLHVVLGNASAHRSSDAVRWLATHSAGTFHFTQQKSHRSTRLRRGLYPHRQLLWRGTHTSVKLLTAAMHRYIPDWNEDCQPFEWTATTEQIIAKVRWVESEVWKVTRTREAKTITGY